MDHTWVQWYAADTLQGVIVYVPLFVIRSGLIIVQC